MDNNNKKSSSWQQLISFEIVSAGWAAINYAILNLSVYIIGIDYRIANTINILAGFA